MTNEYKLSVVVLVYNTERFLEECFESIVNQTLKDIEIILVNDESTDNSLDIMERYCSKYSNIRIINQKNTGGAIAGNRGLRSAKGEYVAIMDSDDVVKLDAYETMYNKAKEEEADIVIGKPMIYVNGEEKEVNYRKEMLVWDNDRVLTDASEFPEIFYDGFYWNKIFRRGFLLPNDCLMPEGMLYADRPMVHKAFLLANKIVICTNTVYLWRHYAGLAGQQTITQQKFNVKNLLDRFESLEYQLSYFNQLATPLQNEQFMKLNIERLLFVSQGIVGNKEFRVAYLGKMKNFLSKVPNVYENDLCVKHRVMVYMILNDLISELLVYVKDEPVGDQLLENGRLYCKLPYFRDEKVKIPDDLFEVT